MMFRHLSLCITAAMVLAQMAHADGLPYSSINAKYRSVGCEYISLKMSDLQIEEVSKTGVISFTPEQLKKLRLVYPKFPTQAGVYSSTHNDGVEPDGVEPYVIWWHADEVIITLEEAEPNQTISMPSGQSVTPAENTLFRLSPDGRIFHLMKQVSLKEAFQLIDILAASPATDKDAAQQSMVIPPPDRGNRNRDLHESVRVNLLLKYGGGDTYEAVLHMAEMLQSYAQAKGVSLFTSW